MNLKALHHIEYGLFVLSANANGKDNACIVNTVAQVTSSPARIAVTVNKQNFTHDMIMTAGSFNVSVLDESAPFAVFERFGFQSGRDTDKLVGFDAAQRAENGVIRLAKYANAFLSGKVISTVDLGTHTMFIAEITDADVLSDKPSMTYSYYHANVKPKPENKKGGGFRCKICGYIYEGNELPPDFVCPLCKHGAEDFEKI